MIEDKEIGLKIAENDKEKFWTQIIEKSKDVIEQLKKDLMFNKEILKMAEKKAKSSVKK